MSEFMGLVHGQYDAKPQGFKPGGALETRYAECWAALKDSFAS